MPNPVWKNGFLDKNKLKAVRHRVQQQKMWGIPQEDDLARRL
jgi:hypothetical protein